MPLNTRQLAFKVTRMLRQIPVWATRRGSMDANIWGLNLIPKFVVHDKRFSGRIVWQVEAIFIIFLEKPQCWLFIETDEKITIVKAVMFMRQNLTRTFQMNCHRSTHELSHHLTS